MTNLIDPLTVSLLAERDDIHPAHAANRLAAAIRIADATVADARVMCRNGEADALAWGRFYLTGTTVERGTGSYILHVADARGASLATRELAVRILALRAAA